MLLRALPNDVADIKERASPSLNRLTAHVGQIFSEQKLHPQTDLWVAIACSVASGVLADALASRKSEKGVADFMLHVRRAATAGSAWEEAQKNAIDVLSIDPAMWFGSTEEVTAEVIADRAHQALQAPDALFPWLTYGRARSEVRQHCARPLLEAMENGLVDQEDVEQAWRVAWMTDAARRLHASDPILLRFAGLHLDGIRKQYARLDASVWRCGAVSSPRA